jgi:hypothetical protein
LGLPQKLAIASLQSRQLRRLRLHQRQRLHQRSCDEKAASATETRASQNRTAAYSQRGNNNEHQPTHPTFPRRGNYPQQFLTLVNLLPEDAVQ